MVVAVRRQHLYIYIYMHLRHVVERSCGRMRHNRVKRKRRVEEGGGDCFSDAESESKLFRLLVRRAAMCV